VAIHAQGDRCLETVLNAFENVLGPHSTNPLRHRIEHAGCVFGKMIQRAAGMNLVMSVQPPFVHDLGDGITESLGAERANRVFPFRRMIEAGIVLGAGSDCPITFPDPRQGIRDAVLRRTRMGKILGSAETLTVDQALRLYSQGSAYLSFLERNSGTIERGKRADFVVLEKDPCQTRPADIVDIPIQMTVVGDEIVYSVA
jgi:predicted amidohydrolase YtcJ